MGDRRSGVWLGRVRVEPAVTWSEIGAGARGRVDEWMSDEAWVQGAIWYQKDDLCLH
jgi:hypothetical protein